MTNNLSQRLAEHWNNRGNLETFAGKFFCYNLIFFEEYSYVYDAIARENQIKRWTREKKKYLIGMKNPTWEFLNNKVCGLWPPAKIHPRF